jgi:hypothetical protein
LGRCNRPQQCRDCHMICIEKIWPHFVYRWKPCGQDCPKVDWRHFVLQRVRSICSYEVPRFPQHQRITQVNRGRCLKAGEGEPHHRWCVERSQRMIIRLCLSSFFDEIAAVRPGSPISISPLAKTLRFNIVSVPWHKSRSGSGHPFCCRPNHGRGSPTDVGGVYESATRLPCLWIGSRVLLRFLVSCMMIGERLESQKWLVLIVYKSKGSHYDNPCSGQNGPSILIRIRLAMGRFGWSFWDGRIPYGLHKSIPRSPKSWKLDPRLAIQDWPICRRPYFRRNGWHQSIEYSTVVVNRSSKKSGRSSERRWSAINLRDRPIK